MSGQPYKYASDVEKFRNEYMENLNLRAELDDKTLQAVKTYVSNGSLPAVSQIPDTRTTSEKLLDIEKLKNDIANGFSKAGLFDNNIAQRFVQILSQSPLNVDNRLITFTAQRVNELTERLKKIYSIGIKGDINDLYGLVDFINNSFGSQVNAFESVKDITMRGITSSKGIAGNSDLAQFLTELKTIYATLNTYKQRAAEFATLRGSSNPNFIRDIIAKVNEIGTKIIHVINIIPTDEEMQTYLTFNLTARQQFQNLFSNYISWMTDCFPNKEVVRGLLSSVIGSIRVSTQNNIPLDEANILSFLDKINGLIPSVANTPDFKRELYDEYHVGAATASAMTTMSAPYLAGSRAPSSFLPSFSVPSFTDFASYLNSFNPVRLGGYFNPLPSSSSTVSIRPAITTPIGATSGATSGAAGTMTVSPAGSAFTVTGVPTTAAASTSSVTPYGSPQDIIDLKVDYNLLEEELADLNDKSALSSGETERKAIVKAGMLNIKDILAKIEAYNASKPPVSTSPVSSPPISSSSATSPFLYSRSSDIPSHIANESYDFVISDPVNKVLVSNIKKREATIREAMINGRDEASMGTLIRQLGEMKQTLKDKIKAKEIELMTLASSTSSGVGFKKRRGRPKGCGISIPVEYNIDRSKGIEQSLKFSPFGKYIIHNGKLRDNVISLKNIKGGNVIGLPSNKVSSHFGKVIKTIIGGGLPSFNDMNGLSEEEKRYLHHISSKANIVDKLNIPTPSKDQEEKDLHLFEVYKGEVMAGNDSKELIQKFKALLLKLSKNGSLPKQQVNEILNEILQLGY